jgi:hypothetical protein
VATTILVFWAAKKRNDPDRLGDFAKMFEKTTDRLYVADFYDPDQ